LDGVAGETCRGLGEATWCNRCQAGQGQVTTGKVKHERRGRQRGSPRQAAGHEAAGSLWTRTGQDEGRREQLVRWWMAEVGEGCAACHVTWQQFLLLTTGQKSRWEQCEPGQYCARVAAIPIAEAKRAIVFPALACCYRCKLPLNWCEE
jgi:hypothetical protein